MESPEVKEMLQTGVFTAASARSGLAGTGRGILPARRRPAAAIVERGRRRGENFATLDLVAQDLHIGF